MTPQQKEFNRKMLEPQYKKDALQIVVERFYTDVDGVILAKTDPSIPAALKTDFPLYVFGEYDRAGAYFLGLKNTPPKVGSYFYQSIVWGTGNTVFGFSGLSDIENRLTPGDLVTVYTDDVNAPSCFVFIVQSCSGKSLASIMQNLPNLPYDPDYGYIRVMNMQYYTNNFDQWKENLQYIQYDFLGLVQSDGLSPFAYKPSVTINDQFIDIKNKFVLTQYLGINTYLLYTTDTMTLTFMVEHRLNELTSPKKII